MIAAEASCPHAKQTKVRMKLLAFAARCPIAGIRGRLFAVKMTMVAPESFTVWDSLIVLIIVVLCGMGSTRSCWVPWYVAMPEYLARLRRLPHAAPWASSWWLMALFRPKGLWPAGRAQIRRPRAGEFAVQSGRCRASTVTGRCGLTPLPRCSIDNLQTFGGVGGAAVRCSPDIPRRRVLHLSAQRRGKTTLLNSSPASHPHFRHRPLQRPPYHRVASQPHSGAHRPSLSRTSPVRHLTCWITSPPACTAATRAGALTSVLRTLCATAGGGAIWARAANRSATSPADRATPRARSLPYATATASKSARASPQLKLPGTGRAGRRIFGVWSRRSDAALINRLRGRRLGRVC